MERTPALREAAANLVAETGQPIVVVLAVHPNGVVEAHAAGTAHPSLLAPAAKAAAEGIRAALPGAINVVRQMRQN